jgi:hypothetical protein
MNRWLERESLKERALRGRYGFPKVIRHTKVRGGDGVARQQVRAGCPPSLDVDVVKRVAYGARGEESVFSLDGDLNLPKGDSHGLRERLPLR